MPQAMDGNVLKQIRENLLARWKRIGKVSSDTFAEAQKAVGDSSYPTAEMMDVAQSLEQMGRDSSLAEQERRELLAIERALSKMATGSFGICEDCGEEIPSKRLLVLPEARLCAHCQAFEEKQSSRMSFKQKTSGMVNR